MPEQRVTIRHTDGREYSIEPKAFTDSKVSPEGSYAERGFEIVNYVGGKPYHGPKSKTEIEAKAAERQEVRAARDQERAGPKPTEKPKGD